MKYYNNVSGLRVYKFFEEFLSDKELKVLKDGVMVLRDHCCEVLELSNELFIKYTVFSSKSSLVIVNNATQYSFESLTEYLKDLIKLSLLDGDKDNFVKIILNEGELIRSIFNLFSNDVKFWIINKTTKISIWNLSNYQFVEYKKENCIILSFKEDGTKLSVFINDTANPSACRLFTTKSVSDLPIIASYVNSFIKERL